MMPNPKLAFARATAILGHKSVALIKWTNHVGEECIVVSMTIPDLER